MNKEIKKLIQILFVACAVVICFCIHSITANAFSVESYISKTSDFDVIGNKNKIWNIRYYYYTFDNEEFDSSHYAVFRNAVIDRNTKYDLVVYCKKGSYIGLFPDNNSPFIEARKEGGFSPYKLVVTTHVSEGIGTPITWTGMLGFADLDKEEYVVFEKQLDHDSEFTHIGSDIREQLMPATSASVVRGWYRYMGKTGGGGTSWDSFDKNCIYFKTTIPADGVIFYHGCTSIGYSSFFAFDDFITNYFPITYTINFDANGGSGSVPNTITVSASEADGSAIMGDIGNTMPVRSDYVFKGWSASPTFNSKRIAYSSVSGGSAASDGTSATTTSNSWSYATYCEKTGGDFSNRTLTLYAQWEYVPSYTHALAYDANGGSGAPSNVTETNTQSTYSMTVSGTVPTRIGYIFLGWNTDSSGNGTNYNAGDSISVGANATVTLYARWQAVTYNIVYYGNNNTGGSTAPQIKTYGIDIALQQNGFIKTNYKFTGWNTAANGTGTSYAAGANYAANADLALYAQWEPIIIYVNYLPNDLDQNVYNDTSTTPVDGKINQDKVLPDTTWTCKDNKTTPALGDTAYTKKGYKFAGWNLLSTAKIGTGTTSDQNGKQYTGTFIPVGTQLTYDQLISTYGTTLNLYAIWEPVRYKIVYHGNNNWNDEAVGTQKTSTHRYDHPQNLESNPFTRNAGETWGIERQVQGYTFIGWGTTAEQHEVDYIDKQNIVNLKFTENAVLNLFALWRKDLVLTFGLQGGLYNNSPDAIQLQASVYNSQKTYVFDIINGQTPANLPKWTEQQGTIDAYGAWDANGLNTKFFKINEKDQKCRFIGWNTDKDLKTPLINMIVYDTTGHITKYAVEHNETLYAIWESELIVSVKAGRNLGDLKMADGALPKSTASNLTAITPVQKVQAIIKPGEQGYYNITAFGNERYNIKVIFDEAITNIYNGGATQDYFDTLNLVTSINQNELLDSEQKHSLNRNINTSNILTARKFYVPQYLGTEKSYPGNIGVQKYYNKFIISQPSYFYQYVKGTDETITVDFELYLTLSSTTGGGGGGDIDPNPPKPTIREFRTTILQ